MIKQGLTVSIILLLTYCYISTGVNLNAYQRAFRVKIYCNCNTNIIYDSEIQWFHMYQSMYIFECRY